MPVRRGCDPPDGWVAQAFKFALDPTDAQRELMLRSMGMNRKAHNWAVAKITDGIERYHESGESGDKPALACYRKQWNVEKHSLCVDGDTGEPWWQDLSKEAASTGIEDAVGAYWSWWESRHGLRRGPRVGFPKFHKKGRCRNSYRIATGSFGLADRRHAKIPRVGVVRLHENARRLDRLIGKNLARIKNATIGEKGGHLFVSFTVHVRRPQANHEPSEPESRVGIDVGTRKLAVVAAADGTILERVEHPQALGKALKSLRRLQRKLARTIKGSKRRAEVKQQISEAHARVVAVRGDALHKLTTRLAKTHGEIVIEGLNVAGMMRQKGPGSSTRKRMLADAALGEFKRQMGYKCGWYGSELVVADRWYPSSQICHCCGHRQKLGREEHWVCSQCDARHNRDDNAAINLARYGKPVSEQRARICSQQSCCCEVCVGNPTQTKRLKAVKTCTASISDDEATLTASKASLMIREDDRLVVNPARDAKK